MKHRMRSVNLIDPEPLTLFRYTGWITGVPKSYAVYVMSFVTETEIKNYWCQILVCLPRNL